MIDVPKKWAVQIVRGRYDRLFEWIVTCDDKEHDDGGDKVATLGAAVAAVFGAIRSHERYHAAGKVLCTCGHPMSRHDCWPGDYFEEMISGDAAACWDYDWNYDDNDTRECRCKAFVAQKKRRQSPEGNGARGPRGKR